jgi:hypothetical protein
VCQLSLYSWFFSSIILDNCTPAKQQDHQRHVGTPRTEYGVEEQNKREVMIWLRTTNLQII